jgi:hypothetical protein
MTSPLFSLTLPVFVLFLPALPAAAGELTYVGSDDLSVAPHEYTLTEWQAGDRVAVAVPDANLRQAPNKDARVVQMLQLGTQVRVRAVASKKTRVGKRVDRWYEVGVQGGKIGFMFGSTLTSVAFRLDFDRDGDEEVVAVAWTSGFKIRVRVWEPEAPAGSALTGLTLEPGGQEFACCGGTLEVGRIDAATAGLPLLAVSSSAEACGDFRKTYVSYTTQGPAAGTLHEALNTGGLSDAPSYADSTVVFVPKQRRAKVISRSWVEEGGGGAKQDLERFVVLYRLEGGVFVPIKDGP